MESQSVSEFLHWEILLRSSVVVGIACVNVYCRQTRDIGDTVRLHFRRTLAIPTPVRTPVPRAPTRRT